MSRVPWREGKVISVEARPGLFALGQMVGASFMAFFKTFHDSPDWPKVSLDELEVLHIVSVVNQFISSSNVKYQKHLTPAKIDFPRVWIAADARAVIRTIWVGSAKEMTIGYMGSRAALIDRGIAADGRSVSGAKRVLTPIIDPQDAETIDSYDVTNMTAYPYQNERLYLCHLLGRNVDVLKDLIFRRALPVEYETYLRRLAIPAATVAKYKPGSVEIDPVERAPYSALSRETEGPGLR